MKFHLVMSLPAMSFGTGFYTSRKGGTGGDGWVYLKSANSIAISVLSVRNNLVGSRWTAFVLLRTNG